MKIEAQLSGANMALKLGELELAAYEYQQIMARPGEEAAAARQLVVAKLAEVPRARCRALEHASP